MKIKCETILEKYNEQFNALFYSDTFIDKYAVLFDRLIAHDEVKPVAYHETDDCIFEMVSYIEDTSALTEFMINLPCDLMFDIYYRYHILSEYLLNNDTVNVSTYDKGKLFAELFTELWVKFIPMFSHKHF